MPGRSLPEPSRGITLNGVRTIPRSQIKELTGTSKSLMPEGLESEIAKRGHGRPDTPALLKSQQTPSHRHLAGPFRTREIADSDNIFGSNC